MPSNHLIFCCPLLLLPSIFPSIRVFSNESALRIRWPKDWSFSFSISPSNEHSGLISLRMDWLDLPAVQGPLESLLQHHSSKASAPKSICTIPSQECSKQVSYCSDTLKPKTANVQQILWADPHEHTWARLYNFICLALIRFCQYL